MPQLDNGPVNCATTQTLSDAAGECKDAPEKPPTRPPPEASALVASLLSGANQAGPSGHVAASDVGKAVAESVSSPVVARLFAPGDNGAIPAAQSSVASVVDQTKRSSQSATGDIQPADNSLRGAARLASRLGSPSVPSAPRRTSAKAQSPYSTTAVALIILVLAALLFGAGLAVGYRISERHPKDVAKSNASNLTRDAGEPTGIGGIAASKPADTQVSRLDTVENSQSSSVVNLSTPSAPTLTQTLDQGQLDASPDNDSDSNADLSNPAAEAGRDRREGGVTGRASASVPDGNFALTKPDPTERATTASQPMDIAQVRPAVPDGAKHGPNSGIGTAVASANAQAVHLEQATPNVSAQSHVILRPIETPASPRRTASEAIAAPPAVNPGSPDVNVLPAGEPQNLVRPSDASPGEIVASQLIHSVQPVYPQEAKKRHIEGDVQLRVVVAADGTVGNVSVVSGPPLLQQAAIEAAHEFRYKPALLNGQAIETVQTVEMSFTLKN